MIWRTIYRPGVFGSKKDDIIKSYDAEYGKRRWRVAWQWGDDIIERGMAYQIYEDSYYYDSFIRCDLWERLRNTAAEVYDYDVSDVKSGLDYMIQTGPTHLQDISIRRVFLRRGWRFGGDELMQIRSSSKDLGRDLSPGKVDFHMPEMIVKPHMNSWWNYDSIEDFYQSGKVLQVRD